MKLTKETGKSSWYLDHDAGTGAELLKNGGLISCRFKVPGDLVANQYVMALYWPVSSLPQGVTLTGDAGNNLLAIVLHPDRRKRPECDVPQCKSGNK
nr:DUF6645 domain-containing protein [Escherichia coli]